MADTWTAPSGPSAGVASLAEMQAQRTDNIDVLSRAVDSDSSASTIKHRHKSGAWASRPAAGEAGRFYYATDLGVLFLDDGTNWEYMSHNARLADYDLNDFHEPDDVGLSANGYIFGWLFGVGAGTASISINSGDDHSICRLNALSTTGSVAELVSHQNNAYITPISDRNYPLIYETSVRLADITSVTYHFGLVSALVTTQAAQPTSSIMFAYGRSGDADLTQYFAVTRDNSGGETTTDTGVTPTTTIVDHLRIEVDSSSEARFYINGVLKATHNASIPTAERLLPGYAVRTNTNANRTLMIDMFRLLYKRYI